MKNAPAGALLWIDRPAWSLLIASAESIERIQIVPTDPDGLASGARQVAETLEAHGLGGRPIGLGLASSDCLSASIRIDDLRSHRLGGIGKHQAWTFRLEEDLPIAAEDVVCDFHPRRHNALGIACCTQWLAPYIQQLETAGVPVAFASPVALLACSQLLSSSQLSDVRLLLWRHHRPIEALVLTDGSVDQWQWLPTPAPEKLGTQFTASPDQNRLPMLDPVARIRLACMLPPDTNTESPSSDPSEATSPIALAGPDWPDVEELALPGRPVPLKVRMVDTVEMDHAAAQATVAILDGRRSPWIDLRRDALAIKNRLGPLRTPLLTMTLSLLLLFGSVIGGLLYRSWQYDAEVESLRQEQATVFTRLFARQSVPISILSRLESEAARLQAIGQDPGDVLAAGSALQTLYEALRRLPDGEELRFRIVEMNFTNHDLVIEGQTRSHADAERLAAALRQQGGFLTQPPRTESLATQGVAFTLSARKSSAAVSDRAPIPTTALTGGRP
ncbi:MAG: hypothetical protein JJU36_05220 [Phycisphaeraceae bacterium]|nr:hypothetical protein [Phycisphaeraceae bacterium]